MKIKHVYLLFLLLFSLININCTPIQQPETGKRGLVAHQQTMPIKQPETICAGIKGKSKNLTLKNFEAMKTVEEKVNAVNKLDKDSRWQFLKKFIPERWVYGLYNYAYFSPKGKIIFIYEIENSKVGYKIELAGTWKITDDYFILKPSGFYIHELGYSEVRFSEYYFSEDLDFIGLFKPENIAEETKGVYLNTYGDVCNNSSLYQSDIFGFSSEKGLYSLPEYSNALKKFCQTHDCS